MIKRRDVRNLFKMLYLPISWTKERWKEKTKKLDWSFGHFPFSLGGFNPITRKEEVENKMETSK